jgi:xylulose-5-phosphate/fructose-6-phosphate phosphoketolase
MEISIPAVTTSPEPPNLELLDAYWRACNYVAACMLYLRANPLLRHPLKPEHIKRRLLGHWGSDPGQSFTWVHLNRVIMKYGLNVMYIAGPGHGAPATLANSYLEGHYSEIYPECGTDEAGLLRLFQIFSFPGGLGSHCTPETPGSIHEGGELGYSLSWHSNKFLNPVRDGAVLPILHLNGYKIANPTIFARISHGELENLLRGYGYAPYFVEGEDPTLMHTKMAETMERCIADIKSIQATARAADAVGYCERPVWPMIVLRSPKGWTGPKQVHGHRVEGSWRAHQIPVLDPVTDPTSLAIVETWLRSYKPDELFDDAGTLRPELRKAAPNGSNRISANPHANGGTLCKPLSLPDFRDYGVEMKYPASMYRSPTATLAVYLRDVMKRNMQTFRVFGPDETASNRLEAIYEVSKKTWMKPLLIDLRRSTKYRRRHGWRRFFQAMQTGLRLQLTVE